MAGRPVAIAGVGYSPVARRSELTWQDLSDLSAAVPLLTRIYPNGSADINHFVAAGGTPFLVHTLLKHGYLHDDVLTVSGRGRWLWSAMAVVGAKRKAVRWPTSRAAIARHIAASPSAVRCSSLSAM